MTLASRTQTIAAARVDNHATRLSLLPPKREILTSNKPPTSGSESPLLSNDCFRYAMRSRICLSYSSVMPCVVCGCGENERIRGRRSAISVVGRREQDDI